MKHTECKDCKLSEYEDCGYHHRVDGVVNCDIPSLSSCDKYGNCMFFQPKAKVKRNEKRSQGEYETACNVLLGLEQIVRRSDGWEDSAVEAVHNAVQTAIKAFEEVEEWHKLKLICANEGIMVYKARGEEE